MKHHTTPAILLKRINYGEADRILTVLTPDYGHVSLLAKGVRKSKSKLAGSLELFSISDITFIDGKSNLKTIISARLSSHFGKIVENVQTTMIGYDVLKYSVQFSEHSTEPAYFELCRNALTGLNENNVSPETVYVWFCARLLNEAGNGINLEKPLDNPAFEQDKLYNFSFDDMTFFTQNNGLFKPNHIKLFRLMLRSDTPSRLWTITDVDSMSSEVFNTFQHIMKANRA